MREGIRHRHVMGADGRDDLLGTIRAVLAGFPTVEIGYVFGSFCSGEFADVDVAVLISGEPSPYLAMRFARKVERAFCHRFEADVKVLNSAPASFQHAVIKSGRPIFSRSREQTVRFEADVLSRYLDYKDTLEWFDRILLSKAI
jgi:uncharacterized protein